MQLAVEKATGAFWVKATVGSTCSVYLVVQSIVFSTSHDLEIVESVIPFVVVQVMDNLSRLKTLASCGEHHQNVFVHIPIGISKGMRSTNPD